MKAVLTAIGGIVAALVIIVIGSAVYQPTVADTVSEPTPTIRAAATKAASGKKATPTINQIRRSTPAPPYLEWRAELAADIADALHTIAINRELLELGEQRAKNNTYSAAQDLLAAYAEMDQMYVPPAYMQEHNYLLDVFAGCDAGAEILRIAHKNGSYNYNALKRADEQFDVCYLKMERLADELQ